MTVIVTGGTGKIGRVFVKNLLHAGYNVFFTGRSDESVSGLIKQFPDYDNKLQGLAVDFQKSNAVDYLVAGLKREGIEPFALVNNARSLEFLALTDSGHVSRENFLGELLIDVVVPYELSVSLVESYDSTLKHIINIGSQYGIVAANPSLYDDSSKVAPLHYGTAKAALMHLTKELAVRFASNEVMVNCIAYGGVKGRVDEAFQNRYAKLVPTGKMLSEEEVFGALSFLLSPGSAGMTGQTLQVDGGWTLW